KIITPFKDVRDHAGHSPMEAGLTPDTSHASATCLLIKLSLFLSQGIDGAVKKADQKAFKNMGLEETLPARQVRLENDFHFPKQVLNQSRLCGIKFRGQARPDLICGSGGRVSQ